MMHCRLYINYIILWKKWLCVLIWKNAYLDMFIEKPCPICPDKWISTVSTFQNRPEISSVYVLKFIIHGPHLHVCGLQVLPFMDRIPFKIKMCSGEALLRFKGSRLAAGHNLPTLALSSYVINNIKLRKTTFILKLKVRTWNWKKTIIWKYKLI